MSNWCAYDLTVSGEAAGVRRFQKFLGRGNRSLKVDKGIPHLKAHEKKAVTPVKNSYDENGWRSENWGKRWGILSPEMEYFCECEEVLTIIYTFHTEGSSPVPVIKAIGEMFPELEIELRDMGNGVHFNGIFVMKDGEIIWDKMGEDFKALSRL